MTTGCKVCGLIGCQCNAVEDTFSAQICRKCRCSPCECEGTPIPRASAGVCSVCRRSQPQCICASHHTVRAVMDVAVRERRAETTRPFSDAYIGILTNEALNFYYNRDAEGLARWLRKVLR